MVKMDNMGLQPSPCYTQDDFWIGSSAGNTRRVGFKHDDNPPVYSPGAKYFFNQSWPQTTMNRHTFLPAKRSTFLTNTLAILVFSSLCASLPAQGTKADYERANGLRKATTNKVFKSRITPNWFADNTRFWYRNELADGMREFIVVDAVKGTRDPAFDHEKMAKSLGKVLGKEARCPAPAHRRARIQRRRSECRARAQRRQDLALRSRELRVARGERRGKTPAPAAAAQVSPSPADRPAKKPR